MTAHDYTTFAEPLAHPGAHLREDFRPDARRLGPGHGAEGPDADRAGGARAAAGDLGHGPAAGAGVRDHGGVLDEPSDAARSVEGGDRGKG